MNRRLIVMRHAKSSWKSGAPSDHARPLNKRGRRDAPRIARRLVDLGWVPEAVLSSDAMRCRLTWKGMRSELPELASVSFRASLYHGALGALRLEVAAVPSDVRTLIVLGHNPGWEDVVGALTGDWVRMTTANAALLSLQSATWSEAIQQRGLWQLHQVVRPKELAS